MDNPSKYSIHIPNWEYLATNDHIKKIAKEAQADLDSLHVLHFPVAFPEVFLRKRRGFDAIIGNPPWDKVKVEEHTFWARHYPGFKGLNQSRRELVKDQLRSERPDLITTLESEKKKMELMRKALTKMSSYPGIGGGDPELYIAFCWRFWQLSEINSGRIGVVLPRVGLTNKGLANFRRTLFENASTIDLTTLTNNGRWVFSDVHPQYTICLACITRGDTENASILSRGPYHSRDEFETGVVLEPTLFNPTDVLSWDEEAVLPLLPNTESVSIFAQFRKSPRLDVNSCAEDWRTRPYAELHATGQKEIMNFANAQRTSESWPVYKGESFDIWNPDTGSYYAQAKPDLVCAWLQKKRTNSHKYKTSPHSEFPLDHLKNVSTLPCKSPRIAFRSSTNRTNRRTLIACLLPPRVFITHQANYLLWPSGDEKDEAYLLGVLCSIPFDWYVRKCTETNISLAVFNSLPIPRPDRHSKLWQRVVSLSGRLASPDMRFANWAEFVGVDFGPLDEESRQNKIFELDAVVGRLYELDRNQLITIYKTFHQGWNFTERLSRVLDYFDSYEY